MKYDLLEPIIRVALDRLYKEDIYLIEHCGEEADANNTTHVSERSIVFRFATYLQELAKQDKNLASWNIDIEYNRNQNDVKQQNGKNVCPDLIIHRRGTHENLLVIEFKTHWSEEHSIENDREKLQSFLEEKFMYQYALLIIIGQNEPTLKRIPRLRERGFT
jgi:hypothetical protein